MYLSCFSIYLPSHTTLDSPKRSARIRLLRFYSCWFSMCLVNSWTLYLSAVIFFACLVTSILFLYFILTGQWYELTFVPLQPLLSIISETWRLSIRTWSFWLYVTLSAEMFTHYGCPWSKLNNIIPELA